MQAEDALPGVSPDCNSVGPEGRNRNRCGHQLSARPGCITLPTVYESFAPSLSAHTKITSHLIILSEAGEQFMPTAA
jgi:hypothetical protein